MKKLVYYCCWAFMLSFMFVAGVGSVGSIWGGFLVLALGGSLYGIILLGDD